jgi:hypothetical protein
MALISDFHLKDVGRVPREPLLSMEDCTKEIMSLDFCVSEEASQESTFELGLELDGDPQVTLSMLRRRKDIKEALVLGFKEAFPERFGEEDEISDESILDLVNSDPEVKTSLIEILLELTDCHDQEGETSYYPSITEFSTSEEILMFDKIIGFRESKEVLPYKYEHLSNETISLIYNNPQILPIISKMKKEQITDKFIKAALGK